VKLRLHERQSQAFTSPATEILYGGAAGGGKSHFLRIAAVAWCVGIPGLQVYLFRREFKDLEKNHMQGPAAFPALLAPWIDSGFVRINHSKGVISFGNGSQINLCHCQHEKDVYGYQGAEIHVLLVDELTHFTEAQYRYLRSRVRLGGLAIPEGFRGSFPRIICGSNPGGIGHNWVKASWIDPAPEGKCWRADTEEGGMLRQFIPAKLADNPTQDPDYANQLAGLGDPVLVEAMLGGNWDIVAGGMFDDVWSRDRHVIPAFEIPASWRIDRSFDWGSTKPFSVGWWAESDGTVAPNGVHYPPRTLIRIAEWYGWNGRSNEGLKMASGDIAAGIVEREKRAAFRGRVRPGPADGAIFVSEPGVESIAETMRKAGVAWTEADKRPGSRVNGWQAIRERLDAAKKGDREKPWLLAFEECTDGFIRTLPVLPRDKTKREDVDTNAEDHTGDEVRYRVLAPRQGMSSHRVEF
jgi:hypothetical protein